MDIKSVWLILSWPCICLAFNVILPEDAILEVPQLVQKYGYPCEIHMVTTSDGYIITMHRIPYGRDAFHRTRSPVFLQHGLISSSADWLLAGPGKSLGYILADAGYDVWLGNVRGNRYSRNHQHLNPNKNSYWNFTWHEIGIYDIPAMIDYILDHTSQASLYYIGHSQGTTVFYVMCSERPEYNAKIKLQMSLAPIAYVDHSSPLARTLAFAIPNDLDIRFEFLQRIKLAPLLGQLLCSNQSIIQPLCINVFFLIYGFNEKELNRTLLPVIVGHTPAGSSIKQFLHYAQVLKSGRFCKWDAGITENLLLYNRISPPDYALEKIMAPIYLYYSRNDFLSNEIDVNRLERRLPNVKGKILVSNPLFNHVDFLYGIRAPQLLYPLLVGTMNASA